MSSLRFWYIGLLLTAVTWGLNAQTRITMIFGGEYPPFYYQNHSQGMFIEFLQHFAQSNPGFFIDVVPLPRKRINKWLEAGKADAFALTSTEFIDVSQRAEYISTEALWCTNDVLVSNRENPISYSGPESLFGSNIGVIIGNHYMDLEAHFDAGSINRVDEYSYEVLLAGLREQLVDGVIISQPSYAHLLKAAPAMGADFVVKGDALYGFSLVTLIHKDQTGFREAYEGFLHEARNTGLIDEIAMDYGLGKLKGCEAAFFAE